VLSPGLVSVAIDTVQASLGSCTECEPCHTRAANLVVTAALRNIISEARLLVSLKKF
jgi:hypothetical protein